MALRYQKPPLVEALCEVRFASSEERRWDWKIPDLLHERIRDRFPAKSARYVIDLPTAGPVQLSPEGHAPECLQLVSADESTIVQVGPDLLAVNSLRPHLGWPDLRDTLLDVLSDYREIASPPAIAVASVRYINRVEIPMQSGLSLERYFTVLPRLPLGVPEAVSTFLMHTEVEYTNPVAIFRFRFATTDSEDATTDSEDATTESEDQIAAFMIDYEHVTLESFAPTFEELRGWLDAGHARIEGAFHGTFTPMTHAEIFQEIRS